MAGEKIRTVVFNRGAESEFMRTLRSRVNQYFKENGISKYGNAKMYVKSLAVLLLYLIPYFLMVTGVVSGPIILLLGLWILMGFGMTGIGCSIMHDANHGAYSKIKWVNKFMGHTVNLVGGSAVNWKIQHNVLHHTYTNIDGMDEDIDPGPLLRLSPHQKWYSAHRYQHLYGWILYGFQTFLWLTTKDFRQLFRYYGKGLLRAQKVNLWPQLLRLFVGKIMYYFLFLVIPIILLPVPWWTTLMFFCAMHFTTGFLFGIIFQTAHVMPSREFPLPDDNGEIKQNWAVHQMFTTMNYSPKSKIFAWYIGGLNHQVEHHLFPTICHVHYPKISGIVKEVSKQFGIPYRSTPTFIKALAEHARMLKKLGQKSPVLA
jgi:linoleoyl-CoA desaturase